MPDVPKEALSRRQVVGTMAVSAAGLAVPAVPGPPVRRPTPTRWATDGERGSPVWPSTAARTVRSVSTTRHRD